MPLFDRLYNFAHWLTQNRDEAEDLVQETYAKALKGFSSFQPGTNFRAWIYRILRNTFFTSRTGLKSAATVPLDLESNLEVLPPAKDTPESILLQRADRQLVQEAMSRFCMTARMSRPSGVLLSSSQVPMTMATANTTTKMRL